MKITVEHTFSVLNRRIDELNNGDFREYEFSNNTPTAYLEQVKLHIWEILRKDATKELSIILNKRIPDVRAKSELLISSYARTAAEPFPLFKSEQKPIDETKIQYLTAIVRQKLALELDYFELELNRILKNLNEKNIKESKDKISKASKKKEFTLKSKWLSSDEQYQACLTFLCSTNRCIQRPFIEKKDDKYFWPKYPYHGFAKYLASFYSVCMDNGWIDKEISGPEFTYISMNTFNVKVDSKPFKHLVVNAPDIKYRKAFDALVVTKK